MTDDLNPQLGMDRRELLRRGAIVGGTLMWAAPAVQSIAPRAFGTERPVCVNWFRVKYNVSDSGQLTLDDGQLNQACRGLIDEDDFNRATFDPGLLVDISKSPATGQPTTITARIRSDCDLDSATAEAVLFGGQSRCVEATFSNGQIVFTGLEGPQGQPQGISNISVLVCCR